MMYEIAFNKGAVPHKFKHLLNLRILQDGVWLAGGAIRAMMGSNEKIDDFDLFFAERPLVERTRKILEDDGFVLKFECPQGFLYTYKKITNNGMLKVQIICEHFYRDMEDVMAEFDLTACRFVTDGKTVGFYYSSYRDTKKKRIVFNQMPYPAATLKRIAKYGNKGYYMPGSEAQKFVEHVYELGFGALPMNERVYID